MSYNLGQIDPDERTGLYADPHDEEPPAPARRALRTAGVLLVMALFAGGLWFAYIEGARHSGVTGGGDIPLIRADTQPMKVKPAEPGGMHIPDRNLVIYDHSRPEIEHLLPPPEQPMTLPAPPPSPPPAAQTAAAVAPTAGPAPLTAEPPPAAAAPTIAAAHGTDHAAARSETPASLPANPRPAAPIRKLTRPEPERAGGVRLQLGAVRSEAAAREEWERIKRTNPDLLGPLTAVAVRADLGDRGIYYRIETAPVGDAANAKRLCGELQQRHLGCIIVR